jgi:hypothetical protein
MNVWRSGIRRHESSSTALVAASVAAFLASQAEAASWHTERAFEGFVPGTHVLAEVTLAAPAQAVQRGKGLFKGWKSKLLAAGYSEADILDGSEISAWSFCYAHNGIVGQCANHGQFLAHVPEELRANLRATQDSTPGDLVDIELSLTPKGDLVGLVKSVYRGAADWRDCKVEFLKPTTSKLLTLTQGPPEGIWLECPSVEADGWIRHPVIGAPFNDGPPVSMWIKPPPAAPQAQAEQQDDTR